MITLNAAFWAGAAVGATAAFWATVWALSLGREPSTADEAERWLRQHMRARR
jgi:hypothetical protein